MRTLRFPFADAKKIAEALPFALESEIPLDLEDIVLSWAILGPTARGKRDGTPETEVLVAYAKKDAVQAHLDLLALFDIDPRHVEFEPLALDDLYDGLLRPDPSAEREGPSEFRTPGGTVIEVGDGAPEPATAIVDIGHSSTSVCLLAGDRVVSAQTVLHGGADATRALAKAIGLPLDEAERGKRKEAFIEVAGARAQFPEQQQISEVLKGAFTPIVRRLRQVFQAAISTNRVRVVKLVLVGGGSGVLNLDRYLSEELNVQVSRGKEIDQALKSLLPIELRESGAPQMALALAYAVSAVSGNKTRARIDFRTDAFAYQGDFDFLRDKAPAIGAWAAVMVLLFLFSGVSRAWVLGSKADEQNNKQFEVCQQIIGKPVDSLSRCMSMVQEKVGGTSGFAMPERSAVDTYLEIAHRLPPASEVARKISELDITSERVKMKGTTSSYEAVDTLVSKLQGGKCFSLVEKGKVQSKGELIEFNISINLDCVAAPGDAAAQNPPEGKPARATAFKRDKLATPTAPLGTPTDPARAVPERPSARPTERPTERPMDPISARELSKGAEPPPDADPGARKPGKLTPEEIEERRERLKKLREERDARRGRLGDLPAGQLTPRGAVRDRLRGGPDGLGLKRLPTEATDDSEEEE
jgi:type IV pilus assembly protein PilM